MSEETAWAKVDDLTDGVRELHRSYSWTVRGPIAERTFTVCRECSEPDEWDDGGPYLYPDVHLVDWPCATYRLTE